MNQSFTTGAFAQRQRHAQTQSPKRGKHIPALQAALSSLRNFLRAHQEGARVANSEAAAQVGETGTGPQRVSPENLNENEGNQGPRQITAKPADKDSKHMVNIERF